MSVDITADTPAPRVEKQAVPAWNTLKTSAEASLDIADKPARPADKPEASPAVASRPNIMRLDLAAGKPAIRVEAPETTAAGTPQNDAESLLFHCVQPYELDSLTHLVKPISLAVAALSTGCALGMIPLVRNALDAVQDLSKVSNEGMLWYLLYAMMFALSSGIAIIAWINVLRGRSDARQLMSEIRKRPKIPLAQVARA